MKVIEYVRLDSENSHLLEELKNDESINQFIHVSENFLNYLLSSENVLYNFIYSYDNLVGSVHIETYDYYAVFSIEILNSYQRQGIASQVLKDLKDNIFNLDITHYKVAIEPNNIASTQLFSKSGFIHTGYEENLLVFKHYVEELFVTSDELNSIINRNVKKVKTVFPKVEFEEYIVIPRLNNTIMLRFYNIDIESISIEDLNNREKAIRELVEPDFLANFLGMDYKKFGLVVSELEKTLLNVDKELQELNYIVIPSYYDSINADLNRLSDISGSTLNFWELQIHDEEIDILFFTDNLEVNSINNLKFSPIKYNASYDGIIKAELHAIKEKVSLVEVLLRYQSDIE